MKTNKAKKSTASKRNPADGPNVKSGNEETRRVAAGILEVLAGLLRPSQAAKQLSVSVPRYYQLELRALEGLVKACEPPSLGPKVNHQKQITKLEKKINRLQADCIRYQALARAAGRAVGFNAPTGADTGRNGRKKPRPAVRALKVARALRPKEDAAAAAKGVK